MAWFKKRQPAPPVYVEGKRGSVLVSGLGYKLDDLPRAFGELSRLTEHDFTAVLKPKSANEWNRTPIEVWVNDVHIGYVSDGARRAIGSRSTRWMGSYRAGVWCSRRPCRSIVRDTRWARSRCRCPSVCLDQA